MRSRSETAQYCIEPSAQCSTLKPLRALRTGAWCAALGPEAVDHMAIARIHQRRDHVAAHMLDAAAHQRESLGGEVEHRRRKIEPALEPGLDGVAVADRGRAPAEVEPAPAWRTGRQRRTRATGFGQRDLGANAGAQWVGPVWRVACSRIREDSFWLSRLMSFAQAGLRQRAAQLFSRAGQARHHGADWHGNDHGDLRVFEAFEFAQHDVCAGAQAL